jgi:hypothetical protein
MRMTRRFDQLRQAQKATVGLNIGAKGVGTKMRVDEECGRGQPRRSSQSRGNATFRQRLNKDAMRLPRRETQRWRCHKTTAILQSQPHLMLLASEGREW